MKTRLFLVLSLLWSVLANAQTASKPLTLKPSHPKAGKEVRFIYNPAGTPLDEAPAVTALVYVYDNNKPNVQEIALRKTKQGWEGNFTPVLEADGAILQFRHDEVIDNNRGKAYSFYFHDSKKQPVAGAAYGLAAAYAQWGPMVGIETDFTKAWELLEQEASRFPAQKRIMTDTKVYTLSKIFKGEESKTKVKAELETLSQLPNLTQEELVLLANYYGRLEEKEKAEMYAAQARAQDPKGELVQSERMRAYYNEKDAEKRKELAFAFAADFPRHKRLSTMLSEIALGYATEEKWQEFDAFLLKYPVLVNSGLYNSAAWSLYESDKNPAKAKELALKAYQLVKEEVNGALSSADGFTTATDWKKTLEVSIGNVADTYGAILLKEGDTVAAEKYIAEAYQYTRGRETAINERYAALLASGTDRAKAQKVLEAMVADGNSTAKIKGYLKELYTQDNNGETGFAAYWAKVEAPAIKKMRVGLQKKMISEKAPSFELVDLLGKPVSLASLKGKTVIVDFWATWCTPCIASFPAMQQVVNKYKENDKIAFVFINSWEGGEDKKKKASDFITKKNYTFQVLMDEENKMIEAFKVSGIPTKFVLDGNGNIRFKSVGYSGSEKALLEIDMMLELLKTELLTSAK